MKCSLILITHRSIDRGKMPIWSSWIQRPWSFASPLINYIRFQVGFHILKLHKLQHIVSTLFHNKTAFHNNYKQNSYISAINYYYPVRTSKFLVSLKISHWQWDNNICGIIKFVHFSKKSFNSRYQIIA